jgi:hypothetical protein
MFNRFISILVRGTRRFSRGKLLSTRRALANSALTRLESERWPAAQAKENLIPLLALLWSLSNVSAATTYYVATNGSSSNDGLTTSTPWPASYAQTHVTANSTIIVMDGTYPNLFDLTDPINNTGNYWKAQDKWQVLIVGTPANHGFATEVGVSNVVVDGFHITRSYIDGVKFNDRGCTVRNCWIDYSGCGDSSAVTNTDASYTGQGVAAHNLYGTIIENNLIENGGKWLRHDHGIYANGTNCIIRNNVLRYNLSFGIQIYENPPQAADGYQIYNNLIYGNGRGMTLYPQVGAHNYIFGNTIIATNVNNIDSPPILIRRNSNAVSITNNICIGNGFSIVSDDASTFLEDYNFVSNTSSSPGTHDTVRSLSGFVNPANGLYWLASVSAARGMAVNQPPPLDFFANSVPSVADVGAFQYSQAYANDSRVLDPSPANGADYWASLGGSPAIAITPGSQDFGSIPIGTTADNTFTVQNTGSGTLSGSAAVSAPFSIISGASYNLAAGTSQGVTVRYSPTAAGTNTAAVAFAGGNGAAVTVSGTAGPAPTEASLSFSAASGIVTSPFVVANGYIYQPVLTGATNGGQAVYNFVITNAGSYVIQALVNAPDTGANSFYVNIDAQPQDPTMIWDIPVTTGFEQHAVSWRGNGTDTNNQFVPKVFSLSVGTHQLVVEGREANAQLEQISFKTLPEPPQHLRALAGP